MIGDPLLGRVIDDKYRIDAEIGAGGMATIYRATRVHIGDVVAIKVLHAELLRDPQFAERFKREAQAAARLKHPNVVAIYDFGVSSDAVIYLVMELVEGRNLRAIIREQGPLPTALAAEIVRQVCAALTEAHRQHIVHRDIKPANIAVEESPDGPRVKVLDFGIASLRGGATMANLTQTGAVMGTPAYMSPEQCLGEDLDGRSDIYSLGVVLFEMLCGVVPFNSPTATAVVMQHVQQAPPPLRVLNVSISPAVEAVVLRALAKRREDRFQTAREFADALAAAATGSSLPRHDETVPAEPLPGSLLDRTMVQSAVRPTPPPVPPRARFPIAIVACIAVAALVAATWFVAQRGMVKQGPAARAGHPKATAAPVSSAALAARRAASMTLVNQYYRLWNARQYAAMYGMLSSRMQRKNPWDQYLKYHSLVTRIDVAATPGKSPEIVNVHIVSRDREKDGSITQNFNAGQWFIAMENGELKLNDQKAHEERPSVVIAAPPAPVAMPEAPAAALLAPPAAPVSSASFVQEYYRLWNARQYDTMYGMLSPGMQRTHPYGDYIKYHAMVVRIDADVTPTSYPYVVNVRIVSLDREKDGSVTRSINEGQWYLTSENGQLKLEAQKLHEVTDAAPRPQPVAANPGALPARLYHSAQIGSRAFPRAPGLFHSSAGCSSGVQPVQIYNDYVSPAFFDVAIQSVDSEADVSFAAATRVGRVQLLSGSARTFNAEVPICKSRYQVWLSNIRFSPDDTGPTANP
jgi:tRNA A-37 threonylcarbamoyl transferase component Bud32